MVCVMVLRTWPRAARQARAEWWSKAGRASELAGLSERRQARASHVIGGED